MSELPTYGWMPCLQCGSRDHYLDHCPDAWRYWQAAEEEAQQEEMTMATMPHCDSAVLHAHGECEYCDAYPEWQRARQMWGIAFTGHPPQEGQLPCPSEVRRSHDLIVQWSGNQPKREGQARPWLYEDVPDATVSARPGLVGMFRSGLGDLAARAKDIARGRGDGR